MNFLSLIEAKREGQALTSAHIRELVMTYTAGGIPDYQMAAFLMAVCFRGLNADETRALTLAMRDSGDRLSWPADPRPLVDKHSTGGVGDKVSLPLAPLLACLGFRVPMISGRGLGITGGTLDKLESIPGFRTALRAPEILETVQRVGCALCGQTDRMVPADQRLYALRDVTGTVPSIPLIVASILSKKLAEGISALVLDVKFGSGAFMPTLNQARELGLEMVRLGNDCGLRTRALLTAMDAPLGRAVGNWLEVKEAVGCLHPDALKLEGSEERAADLHELVVSCAGELLVQTGRVADLVAARTEAKRCLASGNPHQKWEEMLLAQGADLEAYHRKLDLDSAAPFVTELRAPTTGYVRRSDARIIAEVVRELGGGRLIKDAAIDFDVGLDQIAKPGDEVRNGSVLARVHARDPAAAEAACARLAPAFRLSSHPEFTAGLVVEVLP